MRQYDVGHWGVSFIFSLRGSVVPKTLVWAVPAATLAAGLNVLLRHDVFEGFFVDGVHETFRTSQIWAAYNFVIGFLVTFRSSQAYARWWEGATLLLKARGEWFNAYSSCIAFSSSSADRDAEVANFHRVLATLMSMLWAGGLSLISQNEQAFDVVDLVDLDDQSREFLSTASDKVEVLLLWVQRLIVDMMETDVMTIPPPVASRIFQELSRGVVNLHDVRKIADYLFPFPYAQLIGFVLVLNAMLSPIICAILMDTWYWAFCASFIPVFFFTGINYVAMEIECPFGVDENDLPMTELNKHMNRTLLLLLDENAHRVYTNVGDLEDPRMMAKTTSSFYPRVRTACEFMDKVPARRLTHLVEDGVANLRGSKTWNLEELDAKPMTLSSSGPGSEEALDVTPTDVYGGRSLEEVTAEAVAVLASTEALKWQLGEPVPGSEDEASSPTPHLAKTLGGAGVASEASDRSWRPPAPEMPPRMGLFSKWRGRAVPAAVVEAEGGGAATPSWASEGGEEEWRCLDEADGLADPSRQSEISSEVWGHRGPSPPQGPSGDPDRGGLVRPASLGDCRPRFGRAPQPSLGRASSRVLTPGSARFDEAAEALGQA